VAGGVDPGARLTKTGVAAAGYKKEKDALRLLQIEPDTAAVSFRTRDLFR